MRTRLVARVEHTVKRCDVPDVPDVPDQAFLLVVNIGTVCGRVSLYAAYPMPGGQ